MAENKTNSVADKKATEPVKGTNIEKLREQLADKLEAKIVFKGEECMASVENILNLAEKGHKIELCD